MTTVSTAAASNLSQYLSTSAVDSTADSSVSTDQQATATRTQDPTVSSDSAASSTTSQASSDMMAMMLAKAEHFAEHKAEQEQRFKAMDTDGNGKVSEQEFVTARPKDVSEEDATKRFTSLDTDKTGELTEAQMTAHHGHGHAHGAKPSGDAAETSDGANNMSSIVAAYRSAGGTADETSAAA